MTATKVKTATMVKTIRDEVGEEEWGDGDEAPPYNDDEWGDVDEALPYNDEEWGDANDVPPYDDELWRDAPYIDEEVWENLPPSFKLYCKKICNEIIMRRVVSILLLLRFKAVVPIRQRRYLLRPRQKAKRLQLIRYVD